MSDPLQLRGWYCLRTQPKSEHIAAGHLRVIAGIEVYCPRLRFRRMTRRGPVWFSEAVFPGYLFAKFVPFDHLKEVTYSAGVSGVLKFGDRLATVADEVIEDLRNYTGPEECRVIDAEVKEGDTVTITGGVFQGLSTVVTQLVPARERVRVLVEFLGQTRQVEVSKSELLPDRDHPLKA
jgi:transcriptional antiterminator RfaH